MISGVEDSNPSHSEDDWARKIKDDSEHNMQLRVTHISDVTQCGDALALEDHTLTTQTVESVRIHFHHLPRYIEKSGTKRGLTPAFFYFLPIFFSRYHRLRAVDPKPVFFDFFTTTVLPPLQK